MADPMEVQQMQDLVKLPGMLKIITNAHACQAAIHPDFAGFSQSKCDRYDFPTTDPRHFILHDVARIEPYAGHPGAYIAYSNEGDYTMGMPADLLNRLLAHRGI